MKTRTKNTIIYSIVIVAYIVLVGFLVYNINSLSDKYNQEELKMVTEVEKEIRLALEKENNVQIAEALGEAYGKYRFDLTVSDGSEIIYKSVPYNDGNVMLGRVRDDIVAKEQQGVFKSGSRDLYVWYNIYELNDSEFIHAFFQTIVAITISSTILIAITIALIYKMLFDPLKAIKKSIELAEDYQFSEIDEKEDNVNKSFKRFTNRLQDNISAVSRQHTELEKRLQYKREHLNNTIVVSRSMVHDLKTPVHQNIIENEIAIRDNQNNKKLIELATKNEEVNHDIMLEINTILKMLKSENLEETIEKTTIDVVDIVGRSMRRFGPSLREKDLSVDFDSPEEATLYVEEPAMILLINNLVSNMVQYASKDSVLEISIEENKEKKTTTLVFENHAAQVDIDRMKKTEQLFNVVESEKDGNHIYSSGNGLYLIKDLTQMLGGNYQITRKNNKVRIEVVFAYEETPK